MSRTLSVPRTSPRNPQQPFRWGSKEERDAVATDGHCRRTGRQTLSPA